jgi:hypothetical protein
VGFLEEGLDFLFGGVVFFGVVESGYCGFVVGFVYLALGFVEEGWEGVGV